MFAVLSKIEIEDLLYAVQTREEVVKKQVAEAVAKAPEIAEDLNYELGRLSIIKQRLERHQTDSDYKDDCRGMFGDICTE